MTLTSIRAVAQQSAEPGSVSEYEPDTDMMSVTVTSRRREERLVDVPVAVSAMTGETVRRYGTTQLSDLGLQIPQVALNKGGAGAGTNLQIRGVGSQANDAGVEQMVSLNVDGVLVSRGRGIVNAGLLDVESVEVLKGPQALFFGKNSPGGVISVNSKNPGTEFETSVRAGYNFRDEQQYGEAIVSIPLSEAFSARVALRVDDSRGYIRNLAQPYPDPARPGFTVTPVDKWSGGEDNVLGRVTLAWRPSNTVDGTLKLYADHYTDNGPASRSEILRCGNGLAHPTLANGLVDPYGDCAANYRRSVSSLDPAFAAAFPLAGGPYFSEVDTYLGSLNFNFNTEAVTFTSTTGYFRFDSSYIDSFDYTSLARLIGSADEKTETVSQELRAVSSFEGRLNFNAGIYYEHLDRTYRQDTLLALVPLPPDPVSGRYDSADGLYTTDGDTYSAFAQLTFKLLENLELAGGARYTHERRSGSLRNLFVNPRRLPPFVPAPLNLPPSQELHPKLKDDNVSPEATLSWHPVESTTLFAAYRTGFLSGGISNPGNLAGTATDANVQFQPVKARGGEVGAKGSFMNGRLGVDANAYVYNYDNLQLTSFDATTFAYITKNAASARIKGAEVQVRFNATAELSLRGFVGYNHGRFQSFTNAQCYAGQTAALGCVGGVQDLSGERLGTSPAVSANIGATYAQPVGANWTAALSLDAFYSSAYNHSAGGFNFRPDSIQDAYARYNASLRVYSTAFEVALIGNNLSNERYVISSADAAGGAPGTIYGTLGRPREVLLQATYNF
jgi:outer membrane receptor protein involved in Fe transport